jgi:MFS family permease
VADARLLSTPFLLCFVANLLQGLAFNLFLHFPGFLKQLGADEVVIGFLSGVTAVAAIAARPTAGRVMDRRGRRGVILLGGGLHVVVCGLYLSVDSIGAWIVIVRTIHGVAEALLFVSLFTFAADVVPAARRTQGLALFGVSGMLPISASGVLGDWILARADYAALFVTALCLAAVSLGASLPLHDPRRPRGGEPSRGLAAAARQANLVPLWFVGLVFATAITAPFIFVKTFVMERGLGNVGGFFSAYALTGLALRLALGWLPDRVGPKRVLFPALASLGLGCIAIGQAHSTRELLFAGVLCGLGHGYTFPILFGLLVTRARDAERGAAMAIFTALFDAGVLIGGPIFGLVIRLAGYPVMYASAGISVLVGGLVFAALDRQGGREGGTMRAP